MLTRLLLVLGLLLSMSACDGEAPGTDAGQPGTDAAVRMDASPPDDAATSFDAATSPDASSSADAGEDAQVALDAGTDASSEQTDACLPPPCPAPPEGCHYEGFTACTCGTLVCAPSECTPACDATKYCNLCGSERTCEDRPVDEGRICPGIYDPVCGCDGRTYSSGCVLGSAGIGLLHDGECGTTH